jgi:predicted nucleotidyltransferase
MNGQETPLQRAVDALARHGVATIVIGGQAGLLHGSPRLTLDVDLCYRRTPQTITGLASALRELGAELRVPGGSVPFPIEPAFLERTSQLTLTCRDFELDLLAEVPPIGGYERLLQNSIEVPLGDCPVRVIGLDDLITIKRAIGRPKDLDALQYLLVVKEMLAKRDPSR